MNENVRIARNAYSRFPVLRGEGRGEGRAARRGEHRSVGEMVRELARPAICDVDHTLPLSPALSPEYVGEGGAALTSDVT